MSVRARVSAKVRRWEFDESKIGAAESDASQATDGMHEAADRIERAAQEIHALDAILRGVDKSVTAAAKRAIKRTGSWPLRLNSRKARRG